MNKNVLLVLASLAIGGGLGYTLSPSHLDGRLSACKDMALAINRALPPIGMECQVVKGEVYIATAVLPDTLISLDGEKEIKR